MRRPRLASRGERAARRGAASGGDAAAFSLLEMIVALGVLGMVIGPLMYIFYVGAQTSSARHSAALLAVHVAAERIQHDLDQMAFPDGPDRPDGSRLPHFRIDSPGPDAGSRITFWIPRVRQGRGNVPRQVRIVPVTYGLEPIGGTDTFSLVRQVGSDRRSIPGVVLREIWFKLLRSLEGGDESEPPPGGGSMQAWGGDAMAADVLRVNLVGVEKPATRAQMDEAREAQRVRTFSFSFLKAIQQPSLVWRLRDPAAGDRFQFLEPEQDFP